MMIQRPNPQPKTPIKSNNSLVPLSVIVNYRKQFGLSPSYFGNAVAMRTIPWDEPLTMPGMVRLSSIHPTPRP